MQAVLRLRILVAERVDDLGSGLERRVGEALRAQRVQQAAERLGDAARDDGRRVELATTMEE